jgi:nucleoside-diphosphate-sugar epimerase
MQRKSIFARMKVLFIGGTGNISSECAAVLQARGDSVAVITRGRSAVPARYQAFVADRKDRDSLRRAIDQAKPDVVINFLGYDVDDVQLDASLCQDVRQYIFISSATVYSKPARIPITEDCDLGNAWWPYAQKKLACERWLMEHRSETGFPVTIVRPSHTYGRTWLPNPVSSSGWTFGARLRARKPVFVMDDGETPWTLTACGDFAAGFAGLVGNQGAIGQSYHLTSDEALSWNEIYLETARAIGVADPIIVRVPTDFICQLAPAMAGPLKGDKSHPALFDNRKFKSAVPGFRCRKTFHEGIRESVEWLQAHPQDQNLKPEVDATYESVCSAWARRCG